MAETKKIRWLPLESNPEVMNKYMYNLGASSDWAFFDVFGFDEDLLGMIPKPVAAVMLLFPISDKSETVSIGTEEEVEGLYYMKQTVGNACGTVGIIHALANNGNQVSLDESKALSAFLKRTASMNKDERAVALGEDESIGSAHESSAQEGQTEAPDINTKVNLHFVAFVHHNGGLYEMDGRKSAPTRHGNTTPGTLLEDSMKVAKQFMERDPGELSFTITALAANS
ncbi:ubiquitin carboxyl-terminal hydrolase isozyme L3-like [Watersipora subatra]|uniref:ubiquitin carboxyl-terminal hydrolase isozyme L3-like n=1 Tax=Watersipora subatra TaxID=2589382 RepID=UPI00355B3D21